MPSSQQADKARGQAHLQAALGPGAMVLSGEMHCLVAAAGLEPGLATAALATLEATRGRFLSLLNAVRIKPPKMQFQAELGLFSKKTDYEAYLKREGLGGLTGSLGATHPVRLISIVLADSAALGQVSSQVVIAHEFLHLLTLKTRLCPSWEAWPRWLHEGLAMQLDFLAALNDTGRIGPKPSNAIALNNPDRAKAWARMANGLEIQEFLKRDLMRNRGSHEDDYAASWAITAALLRWQEGRLFAAFLDMLSLMEMQYEPEQSLESHSADWLVNELGPAWPDFVKSVKSI